MKSYVCSFIALFTFTVASWAADVKSPGTPAERQARVFASAQQVTTESAGGFTVSEDGTNILVLKFSTNSGTASKLRLNNLRLPQGAKLVAYGLDNGAVTQTAGPWHGAGPMHGEAFDTPALSGSEIVLELQVTGEELPADLPFDVVDVVAAEGAEPAALAGPDTVETRTSLFRGMELTHEVRDGQAIFEGDIVLADEELRPATGGKSDRREAVGITGDRFRWPGGVIPYRIDPALPNQQRVIDAINHWNTVMAGVIKLVPFSGQMAHIYVSRHSSPSQCASNVGMIGYMQYLWVGDYCGFGNIVHEFGHSVGLWHEQSREDRDRFVKILWANIATSSQFNFTQNILNGDDYGTYDYGSIMHYPASSFSINGQPTIETIPAGIPIGQRYGLSAGDIAAVKTMYGATLATPATSTPTPAPAPSPTTVAVTISTNPIGVPFTVDGAQYTTSVTLAWVPGSTHTIASAASYSGNGARATFVNWTDGGAMTHSVVAPTAATGYKANYTMAYSVSAVASGAGSVTVSPVSADTYYAPNTILVLNAAPGYGNCFAGWQGLLTGTPASTTLQVTRAYSLIAKFQPGSITIPTLNYYVVGAGGLLNIGVQATTGCIWKAITNVAWIKISGSGTGTGSGPVTVTVDPNPTTMARVGVVAVNGKIALISQAGKL